LVVSEAEPRSAWSITQDEPYLPGIPIFLPFRSAAVLIPDDSLANTIDGNLPYTVATYLIGTPWLTAGMTLVPSDSPRSTWPLPTLGTRSASIAFWKVTAKPSAA